MRGLEQIPWLYDAGMRIADATGLGRWRSWLVTGATGAVLEVGSGTGLNLPRYETTSVVGLDPSLDALRVARKRAPHALLVCASAEALPFADGAFDTVVSSLVFCSIPDPPRALAEVARVLRPTGTLRMLEHVRSRGARGRLQDLVQPVWTALSGGCHPNRDTERSVQESGFELDPQSRRARGTLRRFVVRPRARARDRAREMED